MLKEALPVSNFYGLLATNSQRAGTDDGSRAQNMLPDRATSIVCSTTSIKNTR
jgi:hypothetical protein